jgi:hypothetical protein
MINYKWALAQSKTFIPRCDLSFQNHSFKINIFTDILKNTMPSFEGNIEKMDTVGTAPVQYFLLLQEEKIAMHELIGKPIELKFTGRINCVSCGKLTKKSFGQGFCFNCFSGSADNSDCILRPEVCEGHLGKGRDPQWEFDHHVKPHYIYLAESGGVKVGVTRDTQIPTRWIDQGAWQAILFAKVPYRKLAGLIEVELKKTMSDKTNWQQMLKNERLDADLVAEKKKAAALLPDELKPYVIEEDEVINIEYPIRSVLTTINSTNLDKSPTVSGVLHGIKGQYLIFENGDVMNLRSMSGYYITLNY